MAVFLEITLYENTGNSSKTLIFQQEASGFFALALGTEEEKKTFSERIIEWTAPIKGK